VTRFIERIKKIFVGEYCQDLVDYTQEVKTKHIRFSDDIGDPLTHIEEEIGQNCSLLSCQSKNRRYRTLITRVGYGKYIEETKVG